MHSIVDDPGEMMTGPELRVLAAAVQVIEQQPNRVTGRITISADEAVFEGHYPGFPILPGVCEVEAADITAVTGRLFNEPVRLAAIESARFHRPVHPDQHLTIDVSRPPGRGPCDCVAKLSTEEGKSATIRLRYEHRQPDTPEPDPVRAGLPHRYPMLLVDRVLHHSPSERIVASKAITRNEPWFRRVDAVSGQRVSYPRALLLESWCQAAALLALGCATGREPERPPILFGGMADVDWHGDAFPGDVVVHEVVHTRSTGRIFYFRGSSSICSNPVLSVGEVTVVLGHTPDG